MYVVVLVLASVQIMQVCYCCTSKSCLNCWRLPLSFIQKVLNCCSLSCLICLKIIIQVWPGCVSVWAVLCVIIVSFNYENVHVGLLTPSLPHPARFPG